ncbi:hypothetical protein BRADI_1g47155v3 [Brachypodium distachyon]|uniref:Uncharacterized protein n=1 Tax=Brachypodium distachyon TaxID=15368 RepID=A0A2K2DPX9_BRADI|nr:hypothetical protein BRADI_1g47155v3 [Brachypodium distachyon]
MIVTHGGLVVSEGAAVQHTGQAWSRVPCCSRAQLMAMEPWACGRLSMAMKPGDKNGQSNTGHRGQGLKRDPNMPLQC